jgi:hypothetical protein
MTINVTPRGGGKRNGARVDLSSTFPSIPALSVAENTPSPGQSPGVAPLGPCALVGRGAHVDPRVFFSHARCQNQDEVIYGVGNLDAAPAAGLNIPAASRQHRFEARTGRFQGEAGAVWALDSASLDTAGAPAIPARSAASYATTIGLGDPALVGALSAPEMFGISSPNTVGTIGFSHAITDAGTGVVSLVFFNLTGGPVGLPNPLRFQWIAQAPRVQTDDVFAANRGAIFQRSLAVQAPAHTYQPGELGGLALPLADVVPTDVVVASPFGPLPAGLGLSHVFVDVNQTIQIRLANLTVAPIAAPAIDFGIIWGRQQVGLGVN